MVSVVPAANADRPQPRVLPKVFADVPSQKELDKAVAAKKALGVWVFVLLVLVAAAGGLAAWELLVGRPKIEAASAEAGQKLKESDAKLTKANASLQEQAKNYEKLSGLYKPFQPIAQSEGEVVDLKSQIQTRLAQYPAARDRTLIDYKENWKAYDSAGVWKGANKTEVGQDLQTKSKLLSDLLKKIIEIQPPPTSPGPTCTDATRCAPTNSH